MKKKYIKIALVATLIFATSYISYNAQNKSEKLSELVLANVDALARTEDFEIVCGQSSGECWVYSGECWLDSWGFLRAQDCAFSGYMGSSCYTPC